MTDYVLRIWAPPGADSGLAPFKGDKAAMLAATVAALATGEGQEPQLLEYVESCDVDARHGMGTIKLTRDLAKARRFASFAEAMAYWRRQSLVRPFRPDGKPNRPLTAYNVTVEKAS